MREGWEIRSLKDFGNIVYGHTAKASLEIEGPKYLRITDIQNGAVEWENVPHCSPLKDYEKYRLKEGDIVFARTGATTGKSFLIERDVKAVFASYLIRVRRATQDIYPKFLYLFFQTEQYWNVINKGISGSAQGGFNASKLGELKIPIPPLPEQKEIVALLDDAFAAIDEAKANLEKNIENAKELFQSKLNEVFSQRGEGWEEKTLGSVYDVRDGTHDSPKYYETGFPLVTSKNLKRGELDFTKIRYISEVDYKAINQRSKVDIGDILFAMIGTIGNPVVIKEKPGFAIKNVALFKVDAHQNSYFLKYYLESDIVTKKMDREAKGTTQRFVGLGYLRKFPIRIPSLSYQTEIVLELDRLKLEIDGFITKTRTKQVNLEDLKKTILQKAFAGELTEKEVVL